MKDKFSYRRLWSDDQGQDIVEYALMAMFVAVAAAAIMPDVVQALKHLYLNLMGIMPQIEDKWVRWAAGAAAAAMLFWIVRRRRINPDE